MTAGPAVTTGYVSCASDLLNIQDLDLIAGARRKFDHLVVGVHTDDDMQRYLGRPPVVPLIERLELISHVRGVDEVKVHDATWNTEVSVGLPATLVPSDSQNRATATMIGPTDSTTPTPSTKDRRTVGYVPGGWDMFHIGHLNILMRAREMCDVLVVGVVTDEELLRVKGKSPIVPLDERRAVVASLDLVDRVVSDFSTDKLDAWSRVGFDVLFKGDDWQGTPKGERLEIQMAEAGVTVRYFPYTSHTSSTKIRALMADHKLMGIRSNS